MARVTVEDCLDHVDNRFQLVLLAAKRARQLDRGTEEATVAWENDKATVVALREIAAGAVTPALLSDPIRSEAAAAAANFDDDGAEIEKTDVPSEE